MLSAVSFGMILSCDLSYDSCVKNKICSVNFFVPKVNANCSASVYNKSCINYSTNIRGHRS